jgi:WD40 repeat protein
VLICVCLYVCIAGENGALLWELAEVHKGGVSCLSVSHNQRFFMTGGVEGSVRVWDIKSRELVSHMKEHLDAVTRSSLSLSISLSHTHRHTHTQTHTHTLRIWKKCKLDIVDRVTPACFCLRAYVCICACVLLYV